METMEAAVSDWTHKKFGNLHLFLSTFFITLSVKKKLSTDSHQYYEIHCSQKL
jgi:hypothetical protein